MRRLGTPCEPWWMQPGAVWPSADAPSCTAPLTPTPVWWATRWTRRHRLGRCHCRDCRDVPARALAAGHAVAARQRLLASRSHGLAGLGSCAARDRIGASASSLGRLGAGSPPSGGHRRSLAMAGPLGSPRSGLDDAAADAARDDSQEARSRRYLREAAEARTLARFVEAVAASLEAGRTTATWSGLATWCRRLVHTYFGDSRRREGASDGRGRWPDHERRFASQVDEAVDRLGHLDEIDANPSLASFRRALQMELEGTLGRRGTFGHGVLTGPPGAALGAELDLVVVCGAG